MTDRSTPLNLNDETDYGLCFVCGPRNDAGVGLRFERQGDRVVTSFVARKEHQGFPGMLHGGVIASVLDEVMSRVSVLENTWTMTARLETRFRQPVPLGATLTAVGEKKGMRAGLFEARGTLLTSDGTVAAEASGLYSVVTRETLAGLSEGYPQLAREWLV